MVSKHYIVCQKCGNTAIAYEGNIPTRGLKWSIKLFLISLILFAMFLSLAIPVWFLWTTTFVGEHIDSVVISLWAWFGLVLSIAATILSWCLAYFIKRKGAVVACGSCGAQYGITPPPDYTPGWDIKKTIRQNP